MARNYLLSFFLLVSLTGIAQPGSALSASEILAGLKKQETGFSVLYIAAHPDDENTRLLTFLSKEKNFRTGYLSLTRGDGGQNLVGGEQGALLGLLRTHELLGARKIDGAEQFFTRANDFGYSKSPDETIKAWNHDSILSDVVWCIRNFKPEIVICRFPSTGEGGHGHHTASALLAEEAFDAAGDPTRFANQLSYTEVWKPSRLFWNTFNFGTTNTTSNDQLKLDVGGYNPLLGKSYGEISALSRSMHKSQGFGSAASRGSQVEYFKQIKGTPVKEDMFEDLNSEIGRFPGAMAWQSEIEKLKKDFRPEAPSASVDGLIKLIRLLKQTNEKDHNLRHWKKIKVREAENLLSACAGLWIETLSKEAYGSPGFDLQTTTQVLVRSDISIKFKEISWYDGKDSILGNGLSFNQPVAISHTGKIPETVSCNSPYWLEANHPAGLFQTNLPETGLPERKAPLLVQIKLEINGYVFETNADVVFKSTDPVKGEIYQPLNILPAITLTWENSMLAMVNGSAASTNLTIKAWQKTEAGKLRILGPSGWEVTFDSAQISMQKGEEKLIPVHLFPGHGEGRLEASVQSADKYFFQGISWVKYDHIPHRFVLKDAHCTLSKLQIKVPSIKIGYIPGAGDEVATCLEMLGLEVKALTEKDLQTTDLSQFRTIITGIRAFNTHENLHHENTRLMDFVYAGGNLVMQYNTNSRIGPLNAIIGPFPFTISRDRVTDEFSPVVFLNNHHSFFHFPNEITSDDFNGWVQERGIYFATTRDSSYTPLLAMNDPGEKPLDGCLIVAKHGKGNFVYTGLSFFRQLPAGNQGAYRLFINLINLPSEK